MSDFKVPVGVNSRNVFDLSHNHVMSHNFGVDTVVSCMSLVPGDDFDVKIRSFTRLTPLPCPTFGGIKLIKRCFFVPYEFVMRGFSDFIAGEKYPNPSGAGLVTLAVPYTTVEDIYDYFVTQSSICYISGSATPPAKQDFVHGGVGYTYTSKGRKLRSWLHTLGIALPFCTYPQDTTKPNRSSYGNIRFDLLKVFAFWKFYLDWVVPARFVNTTPFFVTLRTYLDNVFVSSNAYLNSSVLGDILDVPVSFLEDDYFTSAFVSAYGPETPKAYTDSGLDVVFSGAGNSTTVKNPTTGSNYDGMPVVESGSTTGVRNLSSLQLLSLGRLQDMVNKRKVTDSHVLDWLRLTYGIAPSKDALRYSTYLGQSSNIIQIGDVMSTANTQSAVGQTYVGEYAGKGLGFSENHWKYKTDKHGVLFVTCEIQTKTSYVNGLSPLAQQLTPKAFFDPHFDNVGVRAVTKRELALDCFDSEPSWSDLDVADNLVPNADSPFGFVPRYSEYKKMDDMISGDFICPSVNAGMDSWYLSRQFGFLDDPKISLDFCSAASDTVGSVYDRIFQNTNNDDHFYSIFNIEVKASRPMESITDYFDTINSEDNVKNIKQSNNNVIG